MNACDFGCSQCEEKKEHVYILFLQNRFYRPFFKELQMFYTKTAHNNKLPLFFPPLPINDNILYHH